MRFGATFGRMWRAATRYAAEALQPPRCNVGAYHVRRGSARDRTTRAVSGMYAAVIATTAVQRPGPEVAEDENDREQDRRECKRQLEGTRERRASTRPPRYPASRPSGIPTAHDSSTTRVGPSRLVRVPNRMRLKMSRPSASVPRRCAPLLPANVLTRSCCCGALRRDHTCEHSRKDDDRKPGDRQPARPKAACALAVRAGVQPSGERLRCSSTTPRHPHSRVDDGQCDIGDQIGDHRKATAKMSATASSDSEVLVVDSFNTQQRSQPVETEGVLDKDSSGDQISWDGTAADRDNGRQRVTHGVSGNHSAR